ncbi:MAG: DEAD/DEAH box helicase [Pirellulales bacterium]|nr:DEAD/DEAH box helicase [Pirellulales bacterium]
MSETPLNRTEIAERYLAQLPYAPYPFQEEALLAYFTAEQGVLVCAPTGMGKTLIAEAALFEALHTGRVAYYTTPLIALTEQKYQEMRESAVRWGFSASDVGLVTGNRRENPDARVLVVVAEILANRLMHPEAFDFREVGAVVMDEFHSFADPERGIVWELTLALLPPQVRLLLLSATVGNTIEFLNWLKQSHRRTLEQVTSTERKVPLSYHWVPDRLLTEQVEEMAIGDEESRKTPALIFCFNREECWNVADQIRGKPILADGQKALLAEALKEFDLDEGAGPKLRQLLLRGVGVHHAGVLPKYRRVVEELFQRKLLSFCVCTETLSAGINLPARSVVLPSIVKGPKEKRFVLDASSAHQMFGRAGRPQFDKKGYVFVLAHEDDVKINRWRERFDQIPDNTKDPGLLKIKKDLKRKMPTRRSNETYWNKEQFEKLRQAPPGKLYSRGPIPWRLLAYMLEASPEVEPIRQVVSKRLMDSKRIVGGLRALNGMLLTLWRAGYVTLEPEPPKTTEEDSQTAEVPKNNDLFRLAAAGTAASAADATKADVPSAAKQSDAAPEYHPQYARPTAEMQKLHLFRGINPLYAVFLLNHLGIADRAERLQAMESVLDLPRSLGPAVRVPPFEELPPGPLAVERLDPLLLQLGLATADELRPPEEPVDRPLRSYEERPKPILTLAEKLRRLFDHEFSYVHDLWTSPVWVAGELFQYNANFHKYIGGKGLQKQEGMIFRHLLRLILLLKEFAQLTPPDLTEPQWREELSDISTRLADCCRNVDPLSTDKALEEVETEGKDEE